ncbi:hypothetical protein H2203_003101 [Taxawa tesnikishii (nom. ined.)]|nr:hypothetical protein H2203_003101 [Dothideales sp. JES 119]
MADPRFFITVILLLFILFSPDQQAAVNNLQIRSRLEEVLAEERHAVDILNRTRYGDFDPPNNRWLNISGFRQEQGYSWNALRDVRDRARGQIRHALGEESLGRLDGQKESGAIPLYQNISGVLNGGWVRSPLSYGLSPPRLNLSAYASDGPFGPVLIPGFGRNLTGTEGTLTVRLSEREREGNTVMGRDYSNTEIEVAREIGAQVTVQDDESFGDGWEMQMYGVHFLETGSVLLTTTSKKFAGIFGMPHMTLSDYQYGIAQELLNRTIPKVIDRQAEAASQTLNPWSSGTDGAPETQFSIPNCDLVVYLQEHVVRLSDTSQSTPSASLLKFIEQELRFPTGAFLPPAPDMRFSMLAFSPDCGFAFESKGPPDYAPQEGQHLLGPKVEVEYLQGRRHLLVFFLVLGLQLWLLSRQMQEASTPSTRSRISFYTISMLALGDGFTTMSFCLTSLFIEGLWVPLIAAAFLAFMSVSFFGMRFLMDIWAVQQPERERRERESRQRAAVMEVASDTAGNRANQAAANTATATTTSEGQQRVSVPPEQTPSAPLPAIPGALPLPATVRRPVDTGATPIILPPDQDSPSEELPNPVTTTPAATAGRAPGFGALYTRFYLLLLGTLFLSLNAASWPSSFRRFYFTFLAFLYLSFWVPQIYRNAMRNSRRAFRWDFVGGQSVLRLAPFAYFYGYSANVLFADIDLTDLAVLAVWVWIQAVLLVSQEMLGPRWFVREAWVPPAYDYHPVLREDEEGGNLPVGFSQAVADSAPASPTMSKTGPSTPGESREKGKRTFDCAICMQELEVPVIGPESAGESALPGGALLARRQYMVTPCRHIFHSACLEGWMKYRLQCPICREGLPPL